MESVFIAVSIALGAAAVTTFIAIVRDVSQHPSAENRHPLRHHFDNSTLRQLRAGDKAIGEAWNTHIKLFPQSRKRLLFGALAISTASSVMCYPLWLALR
jgi:hypothetical protein